jgi:cytochrome c-type biogenesis protein
MLDFGLLVALFAGLVSFLSPCVLPIIPGFLAYLSGTSTGDSEGGKRFAIFLNSVFFVLGFSVVFALLGVLLNTLLESIAYDVQIWLARIGGAIIIFFGLYLTGMIHPAFLAREHKLKVTRSFGNRYLTSFLFGSAFAAGWTPCVGAALGAILGLAASQPGTAFSLLMAYAIGLGIPFLIVGFFTERASGLINRYANKLAYVNIVFGIILIGLGVLVFTQNLNLIASFDFVNEILLSL